MPFKISIAFHIMGIVMWIGSMLICSRFIAMSINEQRDNSAWFSKIFWGWTLPGVLITVFSGIAQLMLNGFGFYFTQGWFHAKLTLVVILLVATFLLGQIILSDRPLKSAARPMAIHGITGLILIIVTFLTILGR